MDHVLQRIQKSNDRLGKTAAEFGTQYELTDTILGRGASSEVRLGTCRASGEQVAVKIIDKRTTQARCVKREIGIQRCVSHTGVVQFHEVFEDSTHIVLVMQLMKGGDLYESICKRYQNGMPEAKARVLAQNVLAALQHLHSRGIIHRDLKPENLLIPSPMDDTKVCIADFGLSALQRESSMAQSICGSPMYMAPEVLAQCPSGHSTAVDMWSFGVILFTLLSGLCPWNVRDRATMFRQIATASYSMHDSVWFGVSAEAKDLISQLLVVDVDSRLTASEALQHPWFQSNDISIVSPFWATQVFPTNPTLNLEGEESEESDDGLSRSSSIASLMGPYVSEEVELGDSDSECGSFADIPTCDEDDVDADVVRRGGFVVPQSASPAGSEEIEGSFTDGASSTCASIHGQDWAEFSERRRACSTRGSVASTSTSSLDELPIITSALPAMM